MSDNEGRKGQKTPEKQSTPKDGSRGPSRTGNRSTTPKGKAPKGKSRKGKREEKAAQPEPETQEEGEKLPEGVFPLFLATKSQEIFNCRVSDDVTEAEPKKLIKKEDILNDMRMRAAISDFSVFKQQMQDYAGEEVLIIYDPDFKYGQNFIIATTEEAKNLLLNPPRAEGEEAVEGEAEEDAFVYTYEPPVSKPWVSQGSEKEIQASALTTNRPKISLVMNRIRKDFGAPVCFNDRNVADAKDGYIECTSYTDNTFDLTVMELEKNIQAIPELNECSTQTDWKYPKNAAVQYVAREMEEEQRKEKAESKELAEVIESMAARFELALQQNEIMNVFDNDWKLLGGDDDQLGSKQDNHLKEYQSFTDLQFSKDKSISNIEWHPTIKGIIAVSVAEKLTFDERIDNAAKIIMTPSLILIWSFTDPIHPQLILEAPDDILCFKFCPSDPNIICGGCLNGQLVLWDISQHSDRLKTQSHKHKKQSHSIPGFEDQSLFETPIVRYCAVSSIEHSHKAQICDILWVPDHMELNRMGVPQEPKQLQNVQIVTCSVDTTILVWDTRPPRTYKPDEKEKNPMGVPTTFKHLDLLWKPLLKVALHKSEPGGDHAATRFTISEKQGDRAVLKNAEFYKERDIGSTTAGGFTSGVRPGSTKQKTLNDVKTHFYVGTEDGEIVYVDWMPQKDQDTGKIDTQKPAFYHAVHDSPVNTLLRSPFFRDIVLAVGGWNFTVWKEGVASGPILTSPMMDKRLTSAMWSPTRPSVIYIGRQDGSMDIWDLLDKTHEPSQNQSMTAAPITCIYPYQVTGKQQLMAVGDTLGTLHILEVPWSLRQPAAGEMNGMKNYIEREVSRRAFVIKRWDFREQEKREIEAEAKRKAGIAPAVTLTDEEVEIKQRVEFHQYEEEENNFLRELGLKGDEDEDQPQQTN